MSFNKSFIFRSTIFIILYTAYSVLPAQEVISTAGEHFESDSGSSSWTLGETICLTLEGEEATATQGFHQPLEEDILVNPIPLMSDWAFIICGLLFIIIGIVVIQQSFFVQFLKIKAKKQTPNLSTDNINTLEL